MQRPHLIRWLLAGGILLVLLLTTTSIVLLRQHFRAQDEAARDPGPGPELPPALPSSRRELVDLGNAHGRDGNWPMAFDCFREVVASGPVSEWEWSWATGSALAAGQTNACAELCRRMLEQFGQQTNPDVAERCAKQCLSLPGLPADLLERAAERADFALAAGPNNRWRQLAKGMAEYRRGRWTNALDALRAPERTGNIEIAAQAWAFGAMARHQLGDTAGAHRALGEASRRLQVMVRTGELGHPRNNTWDNCARAVAVRAEAERLIHGRELTPPLDPAAVTQNRRTWRRVLQALDAAEQAAAQEDWPQASAGYAAALQLPAFDWENLELRESIVAQKMSVTFLLAGEGSRHRDLSAVLLDRNPDGMTSTTQERYASAILAGTNTLSPELSRRALDLARIAYEDPGADQNPWRLLLRGMADYRAGQDEAVVAVLSRVDFPGDPVARGRAFVFLSLALHRLGRTAEAAQIWNEAEKARKSARNAGWWNLAAYQLAAREFQSLTNASNDPAPRQ